MSTAAPQPTPAAPTPVTPAPTVAPPPIAVSDFPGAQAAALTVTADGTAYLALGQQDGILILRSNDGGLTFGPPIRANPDVPAFAMRIERPSIIAHPDGRVGVTWLQLFDSTHASVWYALSRDGGASFGPGTLVSAPEQYRTMMVRMAADESQNPVIAWLQDGHLHVARSFDSGGSFPSNQVVDDRACDCCQPQPLAQDGQIFVAYRNLENDAEGRAIRDIYLIASPDDGLTFVSPVRVSDAPWYLDACPTSGPAMVYGNGRLYVSWMDGRNDLNHDLSRSDIWLAVSSDGGQSFSANVRVNPVEGHFNNLPALAFGAGGLLHIVWQADEDSRKVLYSSTSADGGRTFSAPWVVVSSDDGSNRGRPEQATLAVDAHNRVYFSWVDDLGAHVAVW